MTHKPPRNGKMFYFQDVITVITLSDSCFVLFQGTHSFCLFGRSTATFFTARQIMYYLFQEFVAW